jgi:flagellar biosynthetic protein FlhB
MIRAVGLADVIVVNPTHYAVALKYEAERGAPEVVAKGAGTIAAAIRARAEEHGVPIVREPLLCRTIYKACEIGQVIPVELYEAVAHLLAFVFGLRARGRGRGFHELPKPAVL